MKPMKILIADDHTIVRKGLKQLLDENADMIVAGEANNGHEVLDRIRTGEYDVVMLDISMPGMSGIDVLKQLKTEKPKLPVLILSMHPEEQYAIRALRAGAAGYLTKESAPDELVSAIRKIVGGKKYISPLLAERLAFYLDTEVEKPLHEGLSDREYQVMCMIASGKTVGQIAETLSLSVKTVSTYRARILEKMNMKNNAELTHYAIHNRLVG